MKSFCLSLLMSGSLFVTPASAVTIIGTAGITGNLAVTPNTIQLFDGAAPNAFAPNGGSGSFAGLTGGTIQELFLAIEPVGTQINVIDFITFLGGAVTPIDFDLTLIQPGFGTLAACSSSAINTLCTPAGSPLTLLQQNGDVLVTYTLDGVSYPAIGGSAATGSPTVGNFMFTASGTIPELVAAINATGIRNQPFSANFTTTPNHRRRSRSFLAPY